MLLLANSHLLSKGQVLVGSVSVFVTVDATVVCAMSKACCC